jgi:uncharacterized membrane protein YGL010W
MLRTKKLYSARVKRIDLLLTDYGQAHRAPGNVVCHAIGITLIVFGLFSMLLAVPIAGPVTAAELLLAAAAAWYFALDPKLGLAMLVAGAAVALTARAFADARIGAAAFVLGWILQAVGHAAYEKNTPAFFRNLVHLLVGPAYLVNKLVRVRPVPGESG